MYWDPNNPLDPASFRHTSQPGDFELESLQLEDVLVTVYQPGGFRPYTASIFQADMRGFRKQWIFYDFLCAENIVGQFDNCLFSLHKPQSIGRTTEKDLKDGDWGRMVCALKCSLRPNISLTTCQLVAHQNRRRQHRPPPARHNDRGSNLMDHLW